MSFEFYNPSAPMGYTEEVQYRAGVTASINTINSEISSINADITALEQVTGSVDLSSLTTDDKTGLINAINENVFYNKALGINVLHYGAHSITETGYETFDSSTAIQNAINSIDESKPSILIIPQGYVFQINGGININKKNVIVTGGGMLVDGTVKITGSVAGDVMNIEIRNIKCKMVTGAEYHPKTINCFEIKDCASVYIRDNVIENYGRAFCFIPNATPTHQSVNNVTIQNNIIKNVDYCLYNSDITDYYLTGDTSFQNNIVNLSWKSHIYMSGVDGLVCDGNTFFTPRHALTEYGISLSKFNYIKISNNQIFETGWEAISCTAGENLTIVNNNMPYCGQNRLSKAVYVRGVIVFNINSNSIERCSDYGIYVNKTDTFTTYGNIVNNIIREIGTNPYYRGADLASSNKVNIYVNDSANRIFVGSNIMDTNVNHLSYSYNGANLMADTLVSPSYANNTTNIASPTDTLTISVPNQVIWFDYLIGATSISNIVNNQGNLQGGLLYLIANNGNVTLVKNSNIITKSGSNLTLVSGTIYVFLVTANIIRQII